MSADNGIYILYLETEKGPEYRVTYAQAIDNIYGHYSDLAGRYEGDNEQLKNFFTDAKVCYTMNDAWDLAEEMSLEYQYLEDGICLINDFQDRGFLFE